ncbi:MAG: stress responsive protein [Clostridiales bacterium 43-6]|nr:MAG: stress responsive protein [Clostridiales bacterium 43-6]
MIKHMVIFNLKHETDAAETKQFLKDGETILTSIPGVQNFGVFRQVSKKNDYDFGFSMEFENEQAYENYNKHFLHVNFVETRWNEEVTKFLEIDFT